MTYARAYRPLLVALAVSVFCGWPPAMAESPVAVAVPQWDTDRTTSPDTVTELKALQDRVKQVNADVGQAVVGILIGSGAGSGVIVSDDGLVLTAAHVIGKPKRKLAIVLQDGSIVSGESLGVNKDADSGMLRITGKPPKSATWPGAKDGKWPFVPLSESGELRKGQWVVALGHPGGPKRDRPPPVRVGRFDNYNKEQHALRTDCTLVGGDSGGPLFDLDGHVVGIHSRIGLFLEYNIHVPTEIFKSEWDDLLAGTVIDTSGKPELGITLDKVAKAATVADVTSGSPADKAGLKVGDVILKFEGKTIKSSDELIDLVSECRPSDTVTIEVQRGDKSVTLKATLRKQS